MYRHVQAVTLVVQVGLIGVLLVIGSVMTVKKWTRQRPVRWDDGCIYEWVQDPWFGPRFQHSDDCDCGQGKPK